MGNYLDRRITASFIIALVVTFPASVIGIILGFVARSQSKSAGVKNTPATIAIVLGFVFLALTIISIILFIATAGSLLATCAGLESGEYVLADGRTLTCG
jgi:quinol-cytochrome oxidoreductase complex cytochrome b subunit